MANVFAEDRGDYQNVGGYGGGFGGSWCIIIVFFVIAWLLFKDGHNGHGYGGYGYPGFGGGCGPCVQPTFKDESNFEEERNINSKLCCLDKDIWNTDKDVWKTACETQQVEHCEAEKTRALIEQNYVQDLRDKLAESQMCNMTLKQEMFTEKKFDQLERMNERRFDQLAGAIGKIDCELPKRPPVFAECVTPNTHDIDCGDRFRRFDRDDFPRRGRCHDGFGWDGCCA